MYLLKPDKFPANFDKVIHQIVIWHIISYFILVRRTLMQLYWTDTNWFMPFIKTVPGISSWKNAAVTICLNQGCNSNIKYAHLTPSFWLHNINLVFSTCPHIYKWILCTENPVLNTIFQDFWCTNINNHLICLAMFYIIQYGIYTTFVLVI